MYKAKNLSFWNKTSWTILAYFDKILRLSCSFWLKIANVAKTMQNCLCYRISLKYIEAVHRDFVQELEPLNLQRFCLKKKFLRWALFQIIKYTPFLIILTQSTYFRRFPLNHILLTYYSDLRRYKLLFESWISKFCASVTKLQRLKKDLIKPTKKDKKFLNFKKVKFNKEFLLFQVTFCNFF